MDSLKEILRSRADKDSVLKEALSQNDLFRLWNLVVDERLGRNTRPAKFKNRTLEVVVTSSSWANQLSLLKKEIVEKLNSIIGKDIVKEVKFRVGKLKKEEVMEVTERGGGEESTSDRSVTEIIESISVKVKSKTAEKRKQGQIECLSCNDLHPLREGDFCKSCQLKKKSRAQNKLKQYLRKTPWAAFADVKHEIPKVTYEKYSKAKREEIAYLKDQINNILFEIPKKEGGRRDKFIDKLKELSYGLVMLRSGKRPEELDEKTLKKYVGSRVRKVIFEDARPRL